MSRYSGTPQLFKAKFKSDQMDDANVTQSLITNAEKSVICPLALKIKLSLAFNRTLSVLLSNATSK